MTIAWHEAKKYEDILYHKADGIAKVTINRPEKRNAFRPRTVNEMIDAFLDARVRMYRGIIKNSSS
jgi:naphthoate synthase